MAEERKGATADGTVSIVRQPIFDEKRRLWGYALCCVGSAMQWSSKTAEYESVAFEVATSAYMGLQQIVDRDQKILVNFNEKNILANLPYALPPELTAVQVTEDIFKRPSVSEALNQLKSDGYMLAVTGFTADKKCAPLYRLADIISINVLQKSREVLIAALADAKLYSEIFLSMQVEDPARFAMCREIGFNLFHGPFFKTPDTITVRRLSSNEVSRFKLLQAIEKEVVDFEQLAETIQSDASLSFRLLAYLNSAAFGLRQKIKSIHQAISLLGWRKMKNWLRVVLLNDVNQSPDAPELMVLAAQRGKFLELIAQTYDYWGFDPESLHMLGIFSLLDAMLGTPMTEITDYLPLDDKLKSALRREPNNEYQPLLELAQYFEEGRWQEAEQMVQKLNMDGDKVNDAFRQAVHWADELSTLHAGVTHIK